jgi:DNA repair protein RadC
LRFQLITPCSPSRTSAESARRLRRSSILDRCARRDEPDTGNPAQESRGFIMSFETTTAGTLYVRDRADYRPATPQEVITAARGVLSRRFRRGSSLDSPGAVRDYLRISLAELEHEVFCMISLDTRHRLIAHTQMFRGTIDGSSVHPREVVKEALKHNAAAVVFAHNHPSGVALPSQADELITQRLRDALALIDVRVLDHLIVGCEGITSFAERGLL